MGDGRLSTETTADALDGTELVEVTQSGNTRVTTPADIVKVSDYYVAGFYPGEPDASAKMMVHVFPYAVQLPSGMTDSQGAAETAATAQTDFDVQKNGISVGTMRFASSGTTATFSLAVAQNFSAGDKLQLIAPGTPDTTLADISWSFKTTKS